MEKYEKKNCPYDEKFKKNLRNRLNRIEGQVRGIQKMIENDIYCDNIIHQISSVRSSLYGVSKILLEGHIKTCVVNKIRNNDDSVIEELLKTIKTVIN